LREGGGGKKDISSEEGIKKIIMAGSTSSGKRSQLIPMDYSPTKQQEQSRSASTPQPRHNQNQNYSNQSPSSLNNNTTNNSNLSMLKLNDSKSRLEMHFLAGGSRVLKSPMDLVKRSKLTGVLYGADNNGGDTTAIFHDNQKPPASPASRNISLHNIDSNAHSSTLSSARNRRRSPSSGASSPRSLGSGAGGPLSQSRRLSPDASRSTLPRSSATGNAWRHENGATETQSSSRTSCSDRSSERIWSARQVVPKEAEE